MDKSEHIRKKIGKNIGYCIVGILWVLFFIMNAHTILLIINPILYSYFFLFYYDF